MMSGLRNVLLGAAIAATPTAAAKAEPSPEPLAGAAAKLGAAVRGAAQKALAPTAESAELTGARSQMDTTFGPLAGKTEDQIKTLVSAMDSRTVANALTVLDAFRRECINEVSRELSAGTEIEELGYLTEDRKATDPLLEILTARKAELDAAATAGRPGTGPDPLNTYSPDTLAANDRLNAFITLYAGVSDPSEIADFSVFISSLDQSQLDLFKGIVTEAETAIEADQKRLKDAGASADVLLILHDDKDVLQQFELEISKGLLGLASATPSGTAALSAPVTLTPAQQLAELEVSIGRALGVAPGHRYTTADFTRVKGTLNADQLYALADSLVKAIEIERGTELRSPQDLNGKFGIKDVLAYEVGRHLIVSKIDRRHINTILYDVIVNAHGGPDIPTPTVAGRSTLAPTTPTTGGTGTAPATGATSGTGTADPRVALAERKLDQSAERQDRTLNLAEQRQAALLAKQEREQQLREEISRRRQEQAEIAQAQRADLQNRGMIIRERQQTQREVDQGVKIAERGGMFGWLRGKINPKGF